MQNFQRILSCDIPLPNIIELLNSLSPLLDLSIELIIENQEGKIEYIDNYRNFKPCIIYARGFKHRENNIVENENKNMQNKQFTPKIYLLYPNKDLQGGNLKLKDLIDFTNKSTNNFCDTKKIKNDSQLKKNESNKTNKFEDSKSKFFKLETQGILSNDSQHSKGRVHSKVSQDQSIIEQKYSSYQKDRKDQKDQNENILIEEIDDDANFNLENFKKQIIFFVCFTLEK